MKLTHADIAEIIKLLDESTLDEFVLEVGGVRVEARRKGALTPSAPTQPTPAAAAPPGPLPPAPRAADPANGAPEPRAAQPAAVAAGQVAITAPMVGTFYRRPSPDSDPYVETGSRVAVGDPLCLVEVMKLYTTVSADVAGTVVAVCADDATLVEYGQTLFVIEPD